MDNGEFQAHTVRINQLVQSVTDLGDEHARTTALELLQSLMDLHGAVLSRMVEVLTDSGEAGRTSLAKLGSDPLVCGLMVLYGIHPVPIEDRVKRALEKVRPQLQKQGGSADLVGVADAVVRVKMQSSGHGHGSADALKAMVEQAVLEAAPEVVEIVVEGLAVSSFVPVNMIQPATKEEKNYEESAA